ncbi:plasmid pRiA4b ORF-3 family protein [Subsaxibacter sp. CAU 1640]|uniref:plasmid pRiA4b ORF-3 family protein n=1 Tax=Subsaxibacter sp. CAU 1640 TaxID=2933271 RepID=UPI002004C017|nr:plasmid pRiA4b ORF-3 family protein [Subsaxibacter sp. CAU 1640]MCK7591712.1 plasmid pRiA4b ORF-3 family protein [Subsaxibacter sp. CAU 1640]
MIYRFRVILDNDTEDNVFRDLEIRETDTLEDLHNVIAQSFGFDGSEMASFYRSDDDWNQGEEFSLFDMSEGDDNVNLMEETSINDVVHEAATKLIYVYDFLNMWTFFVELAEIVDETDSVDYPNLMFAHGQIPDEAPEKSFLAEDFDEFNEFEDDLDIDDYDELNFDENWN